MAGAAAADDAVRAAWLSPLARWVRSAGQVGLPAERSTPGDQRSSDRTAAAITAAGRGVPGAKASAHIAIVRASNVLTEADKVVAGSLNA